MLSRIFKRGSKGAEESAPLPSTPGKFDEMAVRRSSRIASAQGTPVSENGSPATVKKRGAEAAASPITQKRQKKLPVRNKDEEQDGEMHSHFEIVMPLKGDVGHGEDREESEEPQANGEEVVGDSEAEGSNEEPGEEVLEEKSTKSQSGKKNKKGKPSAEPVAKAPKPKHKKFGDDEPAVEIPEAIEEVAVDPEEEEEEEDSDDEAPEEVGAEAATAAAQKQSLKAAKAAEEYVCPLSIIASPTNS